MSSDASSLFTQKEPIVSHPCRVPSAILVCTSLYSQSLYPSSCRQYPIRSCLWFVENRDVMFLRACTAGHEKSARALCVGKRNNNNLQTVSVRYAFWKLSVWSAYRLVALLHWPDDSFGVVTLGDFECDEVQCRFLSAEIPTYTVESLLRCWVIEDTCFVALIIHWKSQSVICKLKNSTWVVWWMKRYLERCVATLWIATRQFLAVFV